MARQEFPAHPGNGQVSAKSSASATGKRTPPIAHRIAAAPALGEGDADAAGNGF
jgi:hypothetical protein